MKGAEIYQHTMHTADFLVISFNTGHEEVTSHAMFKIYPIFYFHNFTIKLFSVCWCTHFCFIFFIWAACAAVYLSVILLVNKAKDGMSIASFI